MDTVKVKKDWFVSSGGNIKDRYEMDTKTVGGGTYGKVVKGKVKGTKDVRAIKIIPKSKVRNPERFATEINILKKMDHPNIIKLYETYEDSLFVYLVME